MRFKTIVGLTLGCLAMVGCAGSPPAPLQTPGTLVGASHALSRHPDLDVTAHTLGHLDEAKNIVYTQMQGGGGVGLGLALGPLGVLSNAKMIEAQTNEDLERFAGKFTVDTNAAFMSAAASLGLEVLENGSAPVQLSPYLLVVRVNDEEVRMAAALIVQSEVPGTEWTGRFMSELPMKMTLEELDAGLDLSGDSQHAPMLVGAFADGLSLYLADSEGRLPLGTERQIQSKILSPRHDFKLFVTEVPSHTEGRLLFRLPGAVYSLQEAHTTILK